MFVKTWAFSILDKGTVCVPRHVELVYISIALTFNLISISKATVPSQPMYCQWLQYNAVHPSIK